MFFTIKKTKINLINFVIARYAHEYKADLIHYATNSGKPADETYVQHIVLQIEQLCVSFKDPAFSAEREVRLVIEPNSETQKKRLVKFRSSNQFIIPHCDTADLRPTDGAEVRLPLKEVLVSPSPHSDLTRRSVEDFLRVSGYRPLPVTPSSIPFRSL